MDATLAIMASVLQQIREWATGLPFWEQAALERIVRGGRFTEDDYEDVLRLLLEAGGLAPAAPRAALTFPQPPLDAATASGRPVRLAQISDLRNVNALAETTALIDILRSYQASQRMADSLSDLRSRALDRLGRAG